MRDLLRSRHPTFDSSSSGIEVESWLLDLGRCFAMHLYRNNTMDRCAIMDLRRFSSTWWCMER